LKTESNTQRKTVKLTIKSLIFRL